jgi:hypothetical protein
MILAAPGETTELGAPRLRPGYWPNTQFGGLTMFILIRITLQTWL